MKAMKKLLAFVLCISLCLGLAVPAMAAGESNTQGVTFSVELNRAEVASGSEDQTVVMTLRASKPIIMNTIYFEVTWDQNPGLVFTGVTANRNDFSYENGSVDLVTGEVTTVTDDEENLIDITDLAFITFKIPANTPAGTYNVGITNLVLTNQDDPWETTASASTTLKVTNQTASTGYSAGVTTTTPEVTEGETVNVAVSLTHDSDKKFNAAELVFSYDPAYLTFNEGKSTLGSASVKANNGTLTLEDYGKDKNCGNGVYTLSFDAIEDGTTAVSLVSVKASNKENAVSSDLMEGVVDSASVSVTVKKKTFEVKLPDGMTGTTIVTDGESYTFSISDTNYIYTDVTATVNGVAVNVRDNGDGTYTIASVTGPVTITVTKTPRSHQVQFTGSAAKDITDAAGTATYKIDYTFTIPTVDGWDYRVTDITINGVDYNGYKIENSVCTVPGADITGDIVITVDKERVTTKVTVEGSGAGAAEGFEVSATIGESYTLTIVPELGYEYSVSATMGEQTVELTQSDNSYTIANVTDDIVFTVNRIVVVTGVSISEYLTVNGMKIWLVTNKITLADGKVPTYNEEEMFWSDAYRAYCYLVIDTIFDDDTAKAAIGITTGTAVEVDYGMDVNMTGTVDANDAQLVYNIYNVMYSDFTAISMEKVLRADVNLDGKVMIDDAAAIIHEILN